jgi:segregation and condensation protein B
VTTETTNTDVTTRQGLEALLFLADEPLDVVTLAELLEVDEATVQVELHRLADEYESERRGMEVRQAAGGWRMYSADAARPVVERWALIGRSGRLTQAALETLAVIAYKQPISRQEIGEIRGVNADGAVRSLAARGFVEEVGRDPGAGQAVLYGTTTSFLERLGLNDLAELPPLTDYLPEAPAPDEPELGALKEIRRRLAAGGDLPSGRLGGRDDAATNTGTREDDDEDDERLPPPTSSPRRRDDRDMDDLSDRLEQAARSAVDRLRQAVAAGETVDGADAEGEDGDAAGPEADDPASASSDDIAERPGSARTPGSGGAADAE